MQLPPERENEPEWLQVRRENKRREGEFAKGVVLGNASFATLLLPMALVEAGTTRGILTLGGYLLALLVANLGLIRPGLAIGSAYRYASNINATYAGVVAALCAIVLLARVAPA
mgnify:FL=1